MRSIHPFRLSTAALACCLLPSAASATGCVKEILVPIRFPAGATCWRHVGIGTTFEGQFRANQQVTATAVGQTYNSDGKRVWVTTGPWQLSVSGPGGFFASTDSGRLNTVLPRTGEYSFSIGPCAVWGNKGDVAICAR
jgi:hypothetical protein